MRPGRVARGRAAATLRRLCLVATPISCMVGCERPEQGPRSVTGTRWDTTLVIGSRDGNDTTLVDPVDLLLWDDLVVVLEDRTQTIRAFDRQPGGGARWVAGRVGEGPGEMKQAGLMMAGANGRLWVVDARNRKVLEFDRAGQFQREQYYRHLPGGVSRPSTLERSVVWPHLLQGRSAYVTTVDSLEVIDSLRVSWPVPDGFQGEPDLRAVSRGQGGIWVAALQLGPSFAVWDGVDVDLHRFLEDIPYAFRPPDLRHRPLRADSARWAARDLAIVGDEVFFLFGGRPRRHAHPEAPTQWLDVYSLSGDYRRSYRLPVDAYAMDTDDGVTFYVLTLLEGAYPQLLGLRLREAGTP